MIAVAALLVVAAQGQLSAAEEAVAELLDGAVSEDAIEAEPAVDCDVAITQMDMNICSNRDFQAAEAALSEQWELTVAEMKAQDALVDRDHDHQPGHVETLLEGQRAWLRYRDAQCESEGFMARGGSLQPMVVAQCETYMTELRTEQLRSLAAGPEGR